MFYISQMDAIFTLTSINCKMEIIHNLLVIKAKKQNIYMQRFSRNFHPPDQPSVSAFSSGNILIICTLFPCMEVEQDTCMYPVPVPCVCVCAHVHAPDLPFLPSLCLTGLSLLPSSSLSRRISLLPAATWSSLTEREGIKDSLISTQIKRHFGFHPTRRLAGLAGPEASVCFL